MRAFIAFPVPVSVQREIIQSAAALKADNPDVKWVKEDNLHITLLFLGDITGDTADDLAGIIKDAAESRSVFHVTFGGLDYFPPRGIPRVLYTPILDGARQCTTFHRQLVQNAGRILTVDHRPLTPHITLGRMKGKGQIRKPSAAYPLRGDFTVLKCVLYESVLQRGGPVYSEIASGNFIEA